MEKLGKTRTCGRTISKSSNARGTRLTETVARADCRDTSGQRNIAHRG